MYYITANHYIIALRARPPNSLDCLVQDRETNSTSQ